MVNIKIDGVSMQVPEGTTILEAARNAYKNPDALLFERHQ